MDSKKVFFAVSMSFLFWTFMDVVSTLLFMTVGGVEGNPLIAFLMEFFSITTAMIIKVVVSVSFILLYLWGYEKFPHARKNYLKAIGFVSCLYMGVVVWNLSIFYRGMFGLI